MGYQDAFIVAAFAGLAQCLTFLLVVKYGKGWRIASKARYYMYVQESNVTHWNHTLIQKIIRAFGKSKIQLSEISMPEISAFGFPVGTWTSSLGIPVPLKKMGICEAEFYNISSSSCLMSNGYRSQDHPNYQHIRDQWDNNKLNNQEPSIYYFNYTQYLKTSSRHCTLFLVCELCS